MMREEFARKFPDVYKRQEKEGSKSALRFGGLILAAVLSIQGVDEYIHNESFQAKVNTTVKNTIERLGKIIYADMNSRF